MVASRGGKLKNRKEKWMYPASRWSNPSITVSPSQKITKFTVYWRNDPVLSTRWQKNCTRWRWRSRCRWRAGPCPRRTLCPILPFCKNSSRHMMHAKIKKARKCSCKVLLTRTSRGSSKGASTVIRLRQFLAWRRIEIIFHHCSVLFEALCHAWKYSKTGCGAAQF